MPPPSVSAEASGSALPVAGASRGRMTDLDGLLERHKQALCWSLSLLVGVIALLEPLTAHAGHNESWMLPSLLVTLACFLNAALARSRYSKAAAHSLVVLLAAFVALQIGHHTGISWAFVLPPLVLFLHPPKRGLIYISIAVLIVTVGFSFGHVTLDLRDHEPFEFWGSFLTVTLVSALLGRDLVATVKALTAVAFRDPLTGMYQRDLFAELAEQQLQIARREDDSLVLLALDVDNLKTVNDRFGHAAGDSVLKAVAGLLSRELRGADIGARFGGDEFVVLLPGVSVAGAEEVALRLLKKGIVSTDPKLLGAAAEITLSIGLAAYPAHGSHLNELLEAADTALLEAKARGKNRLMKAEVSTSSSVRVKAPPSMVSV